MADITLTFAADESAATEAFSNVGDSATAMGDEVESSSSAFDSVGDAAAGLRSPVRGLASTFRGANQTMDGFGKLAEGDVMGGLSSMAMGVSGLVRGLTTFLIPALSATVGWLKTTKIAMVAQAVWSGIVSAATKVWAGIQAIFNAIMMLNPVVLIIAAIVILIGIIVLIATKTTWFQTIWKAAWKGIQAVISWWWENVVKRYFNALKAVWDGIIAGVKMVWDGVQMYFGFWRGILDRVVGWVRAIPNRIRNALSGLADAISAPFRAGFQAAKDFWNSTLGGRGFDIPSWVPGVGGNSFRFPRFHQGGVVPGAPGSEMMAILQAGETVIPAGQSGGGVTIVVQAGGGTSIEQAFAALFLYLIRIRAIQLIVRNGRVSVA